MVPPLLTLEYISEDDYAILDCYIHNMLNTLKIKDKIDRDTVTSIPNKKFKFLHAYKHNDDENASKLSKEKESQLLSVKEFLSEYIIDNIDQEKTPDGIRDTASSLIYDQLDGIISLYEMLNDNDEHFNNQKPHKLYEKMKSLYGSEIVNLFFNNDRETIVNKIINLLTRFSIIYSSNSIMGREIEVRYLISPKYLFPEPIRKNMKSRSIGSLGMFFPYILQHESFILNNKWIDVNGYQHYRILIQ